MSSCWPTGACAGVTAFRKSWTVSESRLDGDKIVCGCHGFTYDQSGTYVFVPGQAPIPRTARVPSYCGVMISGGSRARTSIWCCARPWCWARIWCAGAHSAAIRRIPRRCRWPCRVSRRGFPRRPGGQHAAGRACPAGPDGRHRDRPIARPLAGFGALMARSCHDRARFHSIPNFSSDRVLGWRTFAG
ncbi:Rieske 2Fe-2S domain-containing protein [Amycolatopsis sp.]|uniref:Rieske 2Fe-2S domain-containing protein n=1 Tax=Amycolatopsis sp. TaxID=37632 RepID=UPI0039C8A837